MDPLVADYHETEDAFPLVYNLGRISLEWNMVEHFFTALIWELLGDFPTGMAVTGGMGNVSKADVILRLVRQRIRNQSVIDRIEFACKAFNILRGNRNILIHSHSIFQPETDHKPTWRRATGRGPNAHASVEADLRDLEELIAQICTLGKFAIDMMPFIRTRNRRGFNKKSLQLPDEFPLPRSLATIPEDPVETAPARRNRRKGKI